MKAGENTIQNLLKDKEAVDPTPSVKDGKINFIEETIPIKAGERYTTDGGKTWNKAPESDMKLTDLGWDEDTPMTIIVRNNTGGETKYDVPARGEAPTKLTAEGVSEAGLTDGRIHGVNNTMEYSTDGGKTWQKVIGNSIEGLKEGDVMVRIAATDKAFASKPVTLTIKAKSDAEAKDKAFIEKGVYYRAHVQNIGWMAGVRADTNTFVGTTGQALRMEALQIAIPEGYSLEGFGHVQNIGDVEIRKATADETRGFTVPEGYTVYMIGTTGQGLRMEAVSLHIVRSDGTEPTFNVQYRAHVQNYGWQGLVRNDSFAGTRGGSIRMEALQLIVTSAEKEESELSLMGDAATSRTPGEIANDQPVETEAAMPKLYYRTHISNVGWLDTTEATAKDDFSGTPGSGKRIEAIQIAVPKEFTVEGYGHVQDMGDVDVTVVNGDELKGMNLPEGYTVYQFGTTGQSKRLEALSINLLEGGQYSDYTVKYRSCIEGKFGWQGYVNNGSFSGLRNGGKRLEAFQLIVAHK